MTLRTWPRSGQDEPPCQISTLKVISFESYRSDIQTDRHTHRVDRLHYPATIKWSVESTGVRGATAGDGRHDGDYKLGDERDGVDDDGKQRLEREDDEDGQNSCHEHEPDRSHRRRRHEHQQTNLLGPHPATFLSSVTPRTTRPPTVSGTGNEYRPKCGHALRLGSKGRMAHSTCG